MGALAEARCQTTSSVARACSVARPRARAADDLSAQGSGLCARQSKGSSHAPEIPGETDWRVVFAAIQGKKDEHLPPPDIAGAPDDCPHTTSTNRCRDRDDSQSHLRMESHNSNGSCQRCHAVLYSLASPVQRGVASKRGPFPLRTAVQRSSDVLSPGFEGWRWRQHATVCSQSARPRIHSAQEQARTKEPP